MSRKPHGCHIEGRLLQDEVGRLDQTEQFRGSVDHVELMRLVAVDDQHVRLLGDVRRGDYDAMPVAAWRGSWRKRPQKRVAGASATRG